jgi:hypothetical protein
MLTLNTDLTFTAIAAVDDAVKPLSPTPDKNSCLSASDVQQLDNMMKKSLIGKAS